MSYTYPSGGVGKYGLYVPRKEGERGFANIEDCIDASIQGLKKNTKKNKKILITAANNSNGNVKNKQKN